MPETEKTAHRQAGEAGSSTLLSFGRKAVYAFTYVRRGDLKGLYRRLTGRLPQYAPHIVMSEDCKSFSDGVDASDSIARLKALRLPSLAGKAFLDVGCEKGFFCGFAAFQGAMRSVGLDRDRGHIARARERFPECEFLLQGPNELPDGMFDVILLTSQLHYAQDQADLIHRLVERLTPNGTLILEVGIAPGKKNEWVKAGSSIDERLFPTRRKFASMLKDYAWKDFGPSVGEGEGSFLRKVVHISRLAPIAYLLMQPPAYGKTTIARALFGRAAVPVVSGDHFLTQLAKGAVEADEALHRLVTKDFSPLHIGRSIDALFVAGLAAEYVDGWLKLAGEGDFAFEGYVPHGYQNDIVALLRAKGYLPVRLEWERFGDGPAGLDRTEKDVESYARLLALRRGRAEHGT